MWYGNHYGNKTFKWGQMFHGRTCNWTPFLSLLLMNSLIRPFFSSETRRVIMPSISMFWSPPSRPHVSEIFSSIRRCTLQPAEGTKMTKRHFYYYYYYYYNATTTTTTWLNVAFFYSIKNTHAPQYYRLSKSELCVQINLKHFKPSIIYFNTPLEWEVCIQLFDYSHYSLQVLSKQKPFSTFVAF